MFGMSVDSLIDINNLTSSNLTIGENLKVIKNYYSDIPLGAKCYGNGYQDDMWTQRIEGYTAYNCIRATYKAYISGDIPVGQSAWDVYADYRNSHANGDNKVVDLNSLNNSNLSIGHVLKIREIE